MIKWFFNFFYLINNKVLILGKKILFVNKPVTRAHTNDYILRTLALTRYSLMDSANCLYETPYNRLGNHN